jgi:uncharacterized protein YijF (DUF1287 family)
MAGQNTRAPEWKTKMGFIKDALDQYEAKKISRWQVINRLLHVGVSADDANQIADRGTIPHSLTRMLLEPYGTP